MKLLVNEKALKLALANVLPFVPKKDPRKILLGVSIQVRKPNVLELCATDGRTMRVEPIEVKCKPGFVLVLSTADAKRLHKSLSGKTGKAEIAMSVDNGQFTAKAITGECLSYQCKEKPTDKPREYPNYDAVIPKDFGKLFVVPTDAIVPSLKRALVFADDRNKAVSLNFVADSCFVESESYETGRFQERITASTSALFSVYVGFPLFQRCIKACSNGKVQIEANQPTTPLIVRSPGDAGFSLLMPIKYSDYDPKDDWRKNVRRGYRKHFGK